MSFRRVTIVGIIFSHKLREAVLSGYDIVTVSEMQNQVEDKFGVDISKGFVILTVAQNEDGTIQFNSYQLSDQCLEMARKGVFAPADAQRRNSAKVKLNPEGWVLYKDKKRSFKHYKVLVENAETDTVPSEFFLINVAIQSHKSWLRTLFPVENREIAPQMMEDARRNMNDKSDPRFFRKISDFHFLNFLGGVIDLSAELPGLLVLVKEQREPTEEESGYQIILDAMIN